MTLRLQRRRFRFALLQPLRTAAGELRERCGWLLRLDDDQGAVGWGEVAPLHQQQLTACEQALAALPDELPQARWRLCRWRPQGRSVLALGRRWRSCRVWWALLRPRAG